MSMAEATAHEDRQVKPIYLVAYPKIIFLYPTMFAALFAGIYMLVVSSWVARQANTAPKAPPAAPAVAAAEGAAANAPAGDAAAAAPAAAPGVAASLHEATMNEMASRTDVHLVGVAFLVIFALNLIVFAFDFPRTTSLTLFFFIAAAVLGLLLTFRLNEQILPALNSVLKSYRPLANATFYFSIFGIIASIFLAVFINVQFDYWEVAPNELLHHHGFLSNLERFSAPTLKIDKEITDIFEYFLLRSGRLILHPSNERRAFVLDNVMNITKKESQLTRMLGALQVQVRDSDVADEMT
ncbi:MAG: hypothetical protein ACKOGA_15855 [Planctomycetaceae bacterium]